MQTSTRPLSYGACGPAPGAASLPATDLDVAVDQAAVSACDHIQPLTLASLGLGEAARTMARAAGVRLTMPRSTCARLLAEQRIEDQDLALAIAELAGEMPLRTTPASIRAEALKPGPSVEPFRLPSFATLTEQVTGVRWEAFLVHHISNWADDYFNRAAARLEGSDLRAPWTSYRHQASIDRSAELLGLPGARASFAILPDDPVALLRQVPLTMGVAPELLRDYFHRLLCDVADWVSYAAGRGWGRPQRGENGSAARQLLTIRVAWELTLFNSLADSRLKRDWRAGLARYARDDRAQWYGTHGADQVLQLACERAQQRLLADCFLQAASKAAQAPEHRPRLQAAFAVDGESRLLCRALATVNPQVDTITFSGFTGLPDSFETDTRAGSPVGVPGASAGATPASRWSRFRRAAVTAINSMAAPGQAFLTGPARGAGHEGSGRIRGPGKPQPAIELAAKVDRAEALLRGMSLTHNFAALVLLVGRSSGSGSDACAGIGGAGHGNVALAAELLNDRYVRGMLHTRGIAVADDTVFVAGLHDTATHAVSLIEPEGTADTHREQLDDLHRQLGDAGALLRKQRTAQLTEAGIGTDTGAVLEARPEITPADSPTRCTTFFVAPSTLTRWMPLHGSTVLHSYRVESDPHFEVLEQILAGPLAAAGQCTLTHNGKANAVARQRLTAIIDAPRQAVNNIIDRHPLLREMVNNNWIQIHVLDQRGQLLRRRTGGTDWVEVSGTTTNTSQTRAA